MATISINGYDISFPYPVPYEIQKAYMEKVLCCLDQKTHAVLESPTGTGKTLCLFAPVTAWTKHQKLKNFQYVVNEALGEFRHNEQKDQLGKWGSKRRSKIWYTSRTHSQIAQTVSEIRKCDTDGLHVRVMGARDQLCINKAVLEEKDSYMKTIKCKELVKNKGCKYYTKLSYEKDFNRYYRSGQVLDIEDLVSLGKDCGICPYFLAKKASETADIILLPYNYIIDKESRDSNGLYLQDDVIIFDEGHNIPSTCEESYEFSITSLDVAIGIKNLKELMMSLTKLTEILTEDSEIDIASHASNSMSIMNVLQKIESKLDALPTTSSLLPVSELYNFFSDTEINERTSKQLVDGIQSLRNDATELSITGSTLETFKLLEKMMTVMFGLTVRSFDAATIERSFKCGVTIDPERHNVKKLSLFCFNPSFGIRSLLQLGVQSIIITSGTLSPLNTFISELGLPNPIRLENGHIAKKCQVPFVILGTGVGGTKMDGSYKNRNNADYVLSLGMTLTNLVCSIPDGVLLLFSSYTMMNNLKQSWESKGGVWSRFNSLKRVFVEPKNKDEFINCMENYRRAIDAGNGAILMGVLRGKISEGMDFKDQYCRGVFIIGVPFPPVQDPRVKGKEMYSESLTVINPVTKEKEKLYTSSFMSVEAMKATNQAIGRVIRHGKDYGVVCLVDSRFTVPKLFLNISAWLRGDCATERNYPSTKKLIGDFFRNIHQGKLGIEEIRCQRVDSNGCPISSYVTYEEYDHKKNAQQPAPWIGGSRDDSKSKPHPLAVRKPRSHSSIEYIDEEDEDLVSMYKYLPPKAFESNSSRQSESLLDALERSRNSNTMFREFNKSTIRVNNKRKHEDKDASQCLSPLVTVAETAQCSQQKKYLKLKVRPLIPADNDEDTNASEIPSTSDNLSKSKENENLKAQLINYYRMVKQSLPKEEEEKFKVTSCMYMKGEARLTEVVQLMDEIFISLGNKNLFKGFDICIKEKDKNEWSEACRKRSISSN